MRTSADWDRQQGLLAGPLQQASVTAIAAEECWKMASDTAYLLHCEGVAQPPGCLLLVVDHYTSTKAQSPRQLLMLMLLQRLLHLHTDSGWCAGIHVSPRCSTMKNGSYHFGINALHHEQLYPSEVSRHCTLQPAVVPLPSTCKGAQFSSGLWNLQCRGSGNSQSSWIV